MSPTAHGAGPAPGPAVARYPAGHGGWIARLPAALRLIILGLVIPGLISTATPVGAQGFGLLSGSGEGPLEIEADDGLEWLQQQRRYVARGNAIARRGSHSIRAQTLTADYRAEGERPAAGGSAIRRIIAEGGVIVASPTERATGDRAVYDVDTGYFVLTGRRVRLDTPQDSITANQSIQYWEQQQIAVATGRALAVRRQPDGTSRVIRADRLESYFREGDDGDLVVRRIIGRGDVCLESATDVARARYGDYDVDTGFAYMQNSVQLFQDGNALRGAAAEVNLNTGVSRMLSGPLPGFGSPGFGNGGAGAGGSAGMPVTGTRQPAGRVVGIILPGGAIQPPRALSSRVRCR